MNEERLKEIEALIDDTNMSAIGEAVEYDSECFEAEREFADNAAEHMRALIAEVRSLRAKLTAVPVAAILYMLDPWTHETSQAGADAHWQQLTAWAKEQERQAVSL